MSFMTSFRRNLTILICLLGGMAVLSPGAAVAKHNLYPETTNCNPCHVMQAPLAEDNTAYLRAGARSIPTMKTINGGRVPSVRAAAGPKAIGCTFCHFNTGNTTRMMDVLEQFNGKMSQHPVDRTYSFDNATTYRNLSLSANTNTTRWISNWDNSWAEPANQVGCTDCHDVTNATANAGTGVGGYPEHPEAATRTLNPLMLKGGNGSWGGTSATNSFCVNICHNGVPAGTAGYKMGHYGWGSFDNTAPAGTLKEPSKNALRTSLCVDCHETHYSGSQNNLFGELGDTGRLLPSQSNNLISASNCTNICHNSTTFDNVGHGRATSTAGVSMGVMCIQCHDSSVSHRTATNPRRLVPGKEDINKATLTENLSTNGIDDDYDGVIDNPSETAAPLSGESNCSAGSCHSDRRLHSGTINGTSGSASCLHCHDMHGNGVGSNIRMIKTTIMGKTTQYTSVTDYFRSDNSATKASLCDNPGCHAKRLGAVGQPGTIMGDVPDHAAVGVGTDCSGCHPHTAATGSFRPDCNGCHSPSYNYTAGTHQLSPIHDKHTDPTAGYGYGCDQCHYNNTSHNLSNVTGGADWNAKFVAANVKIKFNGRINPANTFGPTYNGVAADNVSGTATAIGTATVPGNGACQGLYCHGNSQSARVWSGYTGAPTWNTAASGACGTCHKVTAANPHTYGAHNKHTDNTTVGYGIACNTCHYVTTSDSITITNKAAHVNAATPTVRVDWNTTDNDVKVGNAYSLVAKSCSNIYCHSTGTKINQATYDNTSYGWPTWTQVGAITCNHCHGDSSRTDGSPNYANGSPKINSHAKHMASGNGCQFCHVQTTSTGTTITTRANHVNSVYNVNPDNASHTFTTPYVSPNCAAIVCHGTKPAAWGGAALKCSDCHLGAGDTDQYQTANANWYQAGVTASIDNAEWSYSGHGRTSGNYDCTANAPANFPGQAGTGDPCIFCHDSNVGHGVAVNPFRLVVQTGVTGYASAGWNATCLVCHSKTQVPPGYRPTGAAPYVLTVGASGHRVDAAHYGAKHSSTDNSSGGYFCWDCHDGHGDRLNVTTGNIAMIQKTALPKTDGVTGARVGVITGEAPRAVTFKKDGAGGDWRNTGYSGLCQVCHHGTGAGSATQAKYYTISADCTAQHNGSLNCISCHVHDNDFAGSCTSCHGDTVNRMWPQNAGNTRGSATMSAYNEAGRHLEHLTDLAARLGYSTDNNLWTSPQQTAMCLYCHDYAADTTHGTAGTTYLAKVFNGAGKKSFWGAAETNATFDNAAYTCANLDCHNSKNTTATYNWYTGLGSDCLMCHTTGGTLDNNPRSGLHAVTAAGVTKHDNTLTGGCKGCHWSTGVPAHTTTSKHINGTVDNSTVVATTIVRTNMTFTDNATANRGTCQGVGLSVAAGCHSDGGAWKRLWSTEADNTTTAVGSTRCNVCHGQWSTLAGSAGWRDNTSHFVASNSATDARGKMHDAAPEDCDQCHVYTTAPGLMRHDNSAITRQISLNTTGTTAAISGTRAGCSACHEGATGTANAHDYRISVFPTVLVAGTVPEGSCYGCHGDGVKRIWPNAPGNVRGSVTMSDYNNDGEHNAHVTDIAARLGYPADNGATWTDNQQQAICLYCHDYQADPDHMKVTGGTYLAKVFNGAGKKNFKGGSDPNATFDNGAYTCANVDCHNNKTTTATYQWYAGATSACVMCHTTSLSATGLDNNPHTGLHGVTSLNITKHNDNLAANGCRECHWTTGVPAHTTTSTHIDNVVNSALATINRANMTFTDCTTNANRSSCQGVGLSVAAGCHSDGGAWKRLWSTEADNATTAVGSTRCNVCHGQWSTLAGSAGWRDNTSHFNADGARTSTHGKTHDKTPEVCTQCHPYDGGANHQNSQITMNDNASMVSDNAASRRAGCSMCHNGVDYANGKTPDLTHSFPMSVFPMQKVFGVGITATCISCHGGTNGDTGQVANNAPNITKYWLTSGHGMRAVDCIDCHDTSYLSGADHKTDGTAGVTDPPTNTNTLTFTGKSGTAVNVNPNLNTAHLKSSFFPTSATRKSDYARAFDQKCGATGVGCHTWVYPISHVGHMHPNSTLNPLDNVLTFGRSFANTPPTPKLYTWYPVISNASDYTNRFYEAPAVWLVQDLTTRADNAAYADNSVSYGVCVTCHDPHGSNVPVNIPGSTTNHMLRGDSYVSPTTFCNTACHGN